jgi:hypothetical protein
MYFYKLIWKKIDMTRKIIISLILIIYFSVVLFSSDSVPILLMGKIKCNKKPIGINFQLVDEKGRITKSASNSNDGVFQQTLQSGYQYNTYFEGYILDSPESSLNIPPYQKYVEIQKDFSLKKLEPNLKLYSIVAFKSNDSVLTNEGIKQLTKLKEFIRSQSNLRMDFEIRISTLDCYFKSKKYKIDVMVKNKIKTKTMTLTPEKQSIMMIEARKNSINNYLSELKINSRNIIFTDESVINKNEKKVPIYDKKNKKSITVDDLFPENLTITIAKLYKF